MTIILNILKSYKSYNNDHYCMCMHVVSSNVCPKIKMHLMYNT